MWTTCTAPLAYATIVLSTTCPHLLIFKGDQRHRNSLTTYKGATKPEITGQRCTSKQYGYTSKGGTTPTFRETSRASNTARSGNIAR